MTWEIVGYSVYLSGVIFCALVVKIPSPLPWPYTFGAVAAVVIWPVLTFNRMLGIGGKR